MGQPSSKDEMTIRHQFDRLCQMALKGEAVNYYKHMGYRRKHEVTCRYRTRDFSNDLWGVWINAQAQGDLAADLLLLTTRQVA